MGGGSMNLFHNLSSAPAFLLIVAVGVVGVLHTMVPDHWAPITLIARQRGWTRAQTARAALGAGTGHVLSTLFLGLIVWVAGLAVAAKFGQWIEILSSGALIGFGLWIAYSGWREMRAEIDHAHAHAHAHAHGHAHHHHDHGHSHNQRTALLLILGSSPMIEGLPAFFAAAKFGVGLIVVMSLVFAASTIITYVVLCVASVAGMERVKFGPLERYGEVLSGLFIALVGVVFWIWPIA
jgi:ABC-type nickel/cobalt efflux system permease component RcnA